MKGIEATTADPDGTLGLGGWGDLSFESIAAGQSCVARMLNLATPLAA